jgi:2-polyprenyl-3-methyl-5-hydroxy-6-metoxy-1,4-benzoquinol methylase
MSRMPEELGSTACKIVDASQEYLSKESVVLDVGCGPGSLTMAIAQNVASVHAIDSSSGMVEVAKARADCLGTLNVNFLQESLSDVVARDGTFTAVTMFNVLHYIKDVPEAARQIEKLLAPGGLFLSSTACLGERRSILGVLTWILTKLRIMPDTHFFKQAELANLIACGGFQIVVTKNLSPLPECFVVAKKAA